MSDLFYDRVFPCIVSLPSDDNDAPPLSEQLKKIPINTLVETGLHIQSRSSRPLKTLDSVFCGAIWGIPYALVYSPLLEGESKSTDTLWMCEQMLNILQANYLRFSQRSDPTSQQIVSFKTVCDTWVHHDFVLTEPAYNQWRARWEKTMLEQHLPSPNTEQNKRKI